MNTILSVGKHNKTFGVNWHSHKNWEIIFCTNGNGHFKLDGDEIVEYSKNDLIIIAPNVIHSNESEHGFTNIHITIDSVQLPIQTIMKISDTSNKIISQCMSQIYFFYNNEQYNKEMILQSLGELIANIIIAFNNTTTYSPVVEKLKNSIVKHFSESTLDLNRLFSIEDTYNINYLKKLFKKEIGTSPQQFLINLRIEYAKKLLSFKDDDDVSISQIAYECGYDDPLYFSRVFKSINDMSPKAYQKEMSKNRADDAK